MNICECSGPAEGPEQDSGEGARPTGVRRSQVTDAAGGV